jgi:hypothetical protein
MLSLIRVKHLQLPLKIVAAVTLVTTLGIALNGSAQAATIGQSITISPPSIDESIQPGSTTKGSFQIINSGDVEYTFNVYATPYRVTNENYNPAFTAQPGTPNAISWFHFTPSAAQLGARQATIINYSISVPENASAHGYYAVAFAQTQSLPSPITGVVTTDRVGEIFFLRVAGHAKQAGRLQSWQANWLQKPPLTAVVRIEDSGAYNFPTTINVQVKNIFGHLAYSYTTTRQILPHTIRRIAIPWTGAPLIGLFKVSGSTNLLGHTAELPTKYVVVMSQTIRLVLLGFVVLVLGAVVHKRFKLRFKKNYFVKKG